MRIKPAPIAMFQDSTVPRGTRLAGWAALTHALALAAPVRRPSCVSERHIGGNRRQEHSWSIFDRRYWPGDTLADHLTFALRHEYLDLVVLKRLFEAAPGAEIAAFVQAAPTGIPA